MGTIVELFDGCCTRCVLSALTRPEDGLVYLCESGVSPQEKERLARFLRARGRRFRFMQADAGTVDTALAAVEQAVRQEPGCVFDLTGGSETLLAAMGMAAAKYGIPFIRTDPMDAPALTADELVGLHGGLIKAAESRSSREQDRALKADAEAVWQISRIDSDAWNAMSRILAMAQSIEGQQVRLDMRRAWSAGGYSRRILQKLQDAGLITQVRERDQVLYFRHKNGRTRRMLTTAGNALELQGFFAALESGFFTDVLSGVQIDWDGVVEGGRETTNEIDVMAVHGAVPLFVSCKNGHVKKEDLYELDAVASRFGGRDARKMLMATGIPGSPASREHLLLRADDMDIALVENTHLLTAEELAAEMTALYR